MRKKNAITVLVLVMCAVFMLAACGNAEANPLVGKWKDEATGMASMEFKDDGTVNIYFMDQLAGSGTYSISGDQITMSASGQSETGTFKIEGNKLTLTNSSGDTQVYVKA